MARTKQSKSQLVVEYFETAPLEVTAEVLGICKGVVARRAPPLKTQPPASKPGPKPRNKRNSSSPEASNIYPLDGSGEEPSAYGTVDQ